MIEFHPGTAEEIHLNFLFKFRFNLDTMKDDWTLPQVLQTRQYHATIFVNSDLVCTWWKMIDLLPGTADQNISYIF